MSGGMIALGVCLGIVLLACILTAAYFLLRRRRRESYGKRVSTARPVSDWNPANVIVPFGVREPQGPRFSSSHPPGTGMRTAFQRPDGSWQFSDPDDQFSPPSLSDIDLEAQRRKGRDAGSTTNLTSHSSKASVESVDIVPPPAYSETDRNSGYLKH
ncbi:hypothetical protein DENSPDRAFT_870975 [Dentipellis sp. KUC8613]|nr:hypothetical protein DENSPDRAFT_870975 [Dentipellis sp. KUC8613]